MKQQLTLQELLSAVAPDELFEDMTYAQFLQLADPGRMQRSAHVRGPPLEIFANDKKAYHIFNFKSYPSTTGFRHRGYIAFKKPKNGKPAPSEQLPVEVDCDCEDYRYRWAWANRQKGAGKIGPQSLNKCFNRAPVKTNPSGKPSLCKHLLAARHYIMGLLQKFPSTKDEETDVDVSWKLDQLVKKSQNRYDNYAAASAKAREMTHAKNLTRNYRNVYGPMPQAEVPPVPDNEPVPLPPEEPGQPLPPQPPPRRPRRPPPAVGQPAVPPPPPEEPQEVAALPPVAAARPPRAAGRNVAGRGARSQNRIRGESLVVMENSENRMNAELLKETKALVEEMGEEIEQGLTAPGDEGAEGMGAPETGEPGAELPPPEGDMLPGEGGSPEDEALNLLREIAGGITRLADEVAPVEAEEEAELEEPLPEPEEEGEEASAVPPVEDEDDFAETMPVPTGA